MAQLDVEGFEGLLRNWISTRLSQVDPIDSLICDGKTLRGSIAENASGGECSIAQVSLGLRADRMLLLLLT